MHWSKACIDYSPELKITNLDAMPHGTGCRWLIVIPAPWDGEYAAKRWSRNPPTLKRGEIVIRF